MLIITTILNSKTSKYRAGVKSANSWQQGQSQHRRRDQAFAMYRSQSVAKKNTSRLCLTGASRSRHCRVPEVAAR